MICTVLLWSFLSIITFFLREHKGIVTCCWVTHAALPGHTAQAAKKTCVGGGVFPLKWSVTATVLMGVFFSRLWVVSLFYLVRFWNVHFRFLSGQNVDISGTSLLSNICKVILLFAHCDASAAKPTKCWSDCSLGESWCVSMSLTCSDRKEIRPLYTYKNIPSISE